MSLLSAVAHTVITGIEQVRCRYQMETGKAPTVLYLGWFERKELQRAMEPLMMPYRLGEPKPKRATYDGMEIYVVDAEHYCACGVLDSVLSGRIKELDK